MINLYSTIANNTIIYNISSGSIIDKSSSKLSAYGLRGQLNYNKRAINNWINIIAGAEVRETHTTSQAGRTYGYNDRLLTFSPVDYARVFNLYNNLGEQPIQERTD